MRLRLSLPSDFSFDAVVRSHGWYDLPPFSYDAGAGVLTAVLAGPTALSFRVRDGRLEVSGQAGSRAALERLTRRIFSLDLDLSGFDGMLGDDPQLRRALSRGGGRMLRAPTLFEDAVKMLLTTNCSWAATRGMVARLVALAGDGGAAFPGPASLARLSPRRLRDRVRCGYRAEALSRLARRVDSGKLDLAEWESRAAPSGAVREAILGEHGFGPYAAEGLLRILGRHDFLALDSWVRKQYRRLHPGPAKTVDRAIARRYARFGDFKGLALWLELTSEWHEGAQALWP
ncbi:MAG TPA: Fe-S cluster assembly protein HesB [Thermoanaerobaculia bacterium]|nr:Fe-S cluster assembly protein HesB [Thermoanaerobaculia bacterium]